MTNNALLDNALLEASIKHWLHNKEMGERNASIGRAACPLCRVYHPGNLNSLTWPWSKIGCGKCPVQAKTGAPLCTKFEEYQAVVRHINGIDCGDWNHLCLDVMFALEAMKETDK